MGFKADFNFTDIIQNQDLFLQNVQVSLFEALDRAAIEIARLAKLTDTYKDRTNNLRSSIGYVLYNDGQKIGGSFSKSGAGEEGNGNTGVALGEDVADKVASKYASGYVVVLVAGMEYAAYVEARGFDVISGATMQFENELVQNLESIKNVTGINFNKAE